MEGPAPTQCYDNSAMMRSDNPFTHRKFLRKSEDANACQDC